MNLYTLINVYPMLDIKQKVMNLSVLPSFEVKLMSHSSFFYVEDRDLPINIKATYVKIFVFLKV